MQRLASVGVALLVAVSSTSAAFAADGCGPGAFRYNPFGRCHWAAPRPYYRPGPAYYGPAYYGPRPGYGWYHHRPEWRGSPYGGYGGYGWRYR